MADFVVDDREYRYDDLGPKPSKNWMQTSTKSISKLQDVKKTFYHLGGGPREREVSCECNYRTKSKSSYLSLETRPPEVKIDNQRSASLTDLTVPRLLKEYSERQTQRKKVKCRPHSAIVVPTREAKNNSKPEEDGKIPRNGAFISVLGNTVSCQPRPPPGVSVPCTNSPDTGAFKGIIHYDRQLIQDTERAAVEGLKKYSALGAAYDDAEEPFERTPLAPRASPEPVTARELATSVDPNDDESLYSEDDVNAGECESQSSVSKISRSMVFEIPTGDVEDLSDDDDDDDELCDGGDSGRLSQISQDYIAKSGAFLSKLEKKQEAEAVEISEMFTDMELSKKKVAAVRPASAVDLGNGTGDVGNDPVDTNNNGNFVCEKEVPLGLNASDDESLQDQGRHFEPYWVEIPSVPTRRSSESNMFSHSQNGHIIGNSARHSSTSQFSANRRVKSASVRRHQSESSLNPSQYSGYAVQGKTITFLNSEELLSRGRVTQAPCRRRSEPQVVALDCPDLKVRGKNETGATMENGRDDKSKAIQEKKVIGKPPRPSSGTAKKKSAKHSLARRNRTKQEDQKPAVEESELALEQEEAPLVKIHVAIKPSLKKSISESCAALLADFLPQTQTSDREILENEGAKPPAVRKTVSFNLAEEVKPLECRDTKISEEKPTVSKSSNSEEKMTVSNISKDEPTSEVSGEKPLRSLLTKKNIETKHVEVPFPPPRYHYYTLPAGIIIQNGSEVREQNGEIQGSPAGLSTNMNSSTSTSKVKQNIGKASNKARILAKAKEAASSCDCSKSECHCRSVTRPTKAVTTEAKENAEKLKEESPDDECIVVRKPRVHSASSVSQREKLLKQRISRPSSAPIRAGGDTRERSSPSPPLTMHRRTLSNRSRPRSASAGHKRSNSDGIKSKPRPSSAHVKRSTGNDARRNRAAVKVLKEGYLFKERPPPPLPPERVPRQKKKAPQKEGTNEPGFEWGKGEERLIASEECEEVYNRMKEKGVSISMETLKRGLMAPARRASDLTPVTTHQFAPTTGLLSRPETWQPLADEFARIEIWDKALKNR